MPIADVWRYRDLLYLFVKRDFVAFYKQTILGPIWFFIQPLFTSLMYLLVFRQIAKLPSDGLPPILFYLSGIICWSYFSDCLNKTSETFTDNALLFGKVYFPRLITPLAIVTSNLLRFGVQLGLLFAIAVYYFVKGEISPRPTLLLLPLLILLMATIGLGLGLIFTSLTTKYRDLKFLLQFGVQLLMYASPVIYPLSMVDGTYGRVIAWNPLSPILEAFRNGCLGAGSVTLTGLLWSSCFAALSLFAGIVMFNRTETSFVDTV